MLKAGLVHFVASDAHGTRDRTTDLHEPYEYIASKYGRDRAEQLFVANPRAAVEGEPLPSQQIQEQAAPRKWYQFWS